MVSWHPPRWSCPRTGARRGVGYAVSTEVSNDRAGADRGVLHGVRVVEVTDGPAEYAGLLLAGMGADVVKVEPPVGSRSRGLGPFVADVPGPGRSLYFAQQN